MFLACILQISMNLNLCLASQVYHQDNDIHALHFISVLPTINIIWQWWNRAVIKSRLNVQKQRKNMKSDLFLKRIINHSVQTDTGCSDDCKHCSRPEEKTHTDKQHLIGQNLKTENSTEPFLLLDQRLCHCVWWPLTWTDWYRHTAWDVYLTL